MSIETIASNGVGLLFFVGIIVLCFKYHNNVDDKHRSTTAEWDRIMNQAATRHGLLFRQGNVKQQGDLSLPCFGSISGRVQGIDLKMGVEWNMDDGVAFRTFFFANVHLVFGKKDHVYLKKLPPADLPSGWAAPCSSIMSEIFNRCFAGNGLERIPDRARALLLEMAPDIYLQGALLDRVVEGLELTCDQIRLYPKGVKLSHGISSEYSYVLLRKQGDWDLWIDRLVRLAEALRLK